MYSDVRRRPVRWFDESNLLEQIGGAGDAFHRVHQGVLVLDVQGAVITDSSKVPDEVGPERSTAGWPSPSVT